MQYKYGNYTGEQIKELKSKIRKQVFFLLLIVDPETKNEYSDIDVTKTIENTQMKIGGYNSLLLNPPELVVAQGLIEAALNEFVNPNFDFKKFRKLILGAGDEIRKIKEE